MYSAKGQYQSEGAVYIVRINVRVSESRTLCTIWGERAFVFLEHVAADGIRIALRVDWIRSGGCGPGVRVVSFDEVHRS